MTRIKICGITNREDALAAVEAGADALGFNAVPESPRYVAPHVYKAIVVQLPPFVLPVVVSRTVGEARPYAPRAVQYYEDAPGESACLGPECITIRAYRIKGEEDVAALKRPPLGVSAVLLDAFHPEMLGGAGESFDWRLAVRAAKSLPLILAGGLTPENVARAIEVARPYAVDVASGVELSPGVKDHEKLRAFAAAVLRTQTPLPPGKRLPKR